MGIAAKLAQASAACRFIEKDGTNALHKYKFTSAASVNGHVNPALVAAGLAIVDVDPVILSDVGTGKDRVVTVKVTIVVADSESAERATFRGIGSGQDAGDKGVMKAETAATKYAWLMGLCIAMGDDPEADDKTDKHNARGAAPPPSSQRREAPRPEPKPQQPDEHAQPGPVEPPAALAGYYAGLREVELPNECVALWMKHRPALGESQTADREAAWKALCEVCETVGKMKGAKVWLKKAIAEETARAAIAAPSSNGAAS